MSYPQRVGPPADLFTSDEIGLRRIAVDAQQTSFEANEQFRLFDRLEAIPQGQQVVYKFESVNPVNIMLRKINLWSGGREYLVYPAYAQNTFDDGLLGSPLPIFNVNSNLHGGLVSHPVSGVTIRKAVGAGIFTSTNTTPPNGDLALTDGNNNRATANYSTDGNRGGVSAGGAFYLVFNHIGANGDTNGQYTLLWEERFND